MIKLTENIDQMRERHKQEIETLQRRCKHKKLSKWMDEWFAPAHSTGRIVKICQNCGKVIKTKNLLAGVKIKCEKL